MRSGSGRLIQGVCYEDYFKGDWERTSSDFVYWLVSKYCRSSFFCCILGCVCGWRLIDRHWFSWDSLYAVLNMRFVFRSNFNETVLTRTFLKRNLYRSREICFSHFCLDFCHVFFQRVKKRFLFSTVVASCVKCVLIVARTFKNSQ